MGKTVKLTLTPTEKKFVSKLKGPDHKNADVLRNALWFYVEHAQDSPIHSGMDPEKTFSVKEKTRDVELSSTQNLLFQDYLVHLKDEIFFLREENVKIQEQNRKFQDNVEEEIKRLHDRQNQLMNLVQPVKAIQKSDYVSLVDTAVVVSEPAMVHSDFLDEIDRVLKERTTQVEITGVSGKNRRIRSHENKFFSGFYFLRRKHDKT